MIAITIHTISPQEGVTFRLFRLQNNDEILLDEGLTGPEGEARIEIESEDREPLHIQLRVFTFEGILLGESPIVYDVKRSRSIRVNIEKSPVISEFEKIQATLDFIIPDNDWQNWTERDIQFNVKTKSEYAGRVPEGHLDIFQVPLVILYIESVRQAAITGLPTTFQYGLGRIRGQGKSLEEILPLSNDEIEKIFTELQRDQILPEIDWEAVWPILDQWRDTERNYQMISFSGFVIDRESESALTGLEIRIFRKGKREVLDQDITNQEGAYIISFQQEQESGISYRAEIWRGNEQLHKEQFEWEEDTSLNIRMKSPPPIDRTPNIVQLANDLQIDLPAGFKRALTGRGVKTLSDIRRNRGISVQNHEVLSKRLTTWAAMQAIGIPVQRANQIFDQGYDSVGKLLTTSRAVVKNDLKDTMSDSELDTFTTELGNFVNLFNGHLASVHLNQRWELTDPFGGGGSNGGGTDGDGTDDDDSTDDGDASYDLSEFFPDACGCDHCQNGVSWAAYLADLIDYALKQLSKENAVVTLQDVEVVLHQPIGTLPAGCSQMDQLVPTIRQTLEVVQRYLEQENLPQDAIAETRWEDARQRYIQNVHTDLLLAANTTLEDIRGIRQGTIVQADVASAMGIKDGQVDDFKLEIDNLTEENLEVLFGYRLLSRDILSETLKGAYLTHREAHLKNTWMTQDAERNIPIIDPDLIHPLDMVDPIGSAVAQMREDRRLDLENLWNTYFTTKESEVQNGDLAAWDVLLPDPAVLDEIRQVQSEAGTRLDQIKSLIDSGEGILEREWDEVIHILVQHYKRSQYQTWKDEEATGEICISPEFFKERAFTLGDIITNSFDEILPWRGSAQDKRVFDLTLEQRTQTWNELHLGWREALREVEDRHLPELRRAMINATEITGNTPTERSRNLSSFLFLDLEIAPCDRMSRMQFAALSLQRFINGIRNGLVQDDHPGWAIEDPHFDKKWKWLGNHQTWRSAMLSSSFRKISLTQDCGVIRAPGLSSW